MSRRSVVDSSALPTYQISPPKKDRTRDFRPVFRSFIIESSLSRICWGNWKRLAWQFRQQFTKRHPWQSPKTRASPSSRCAAPPTRGQPRQGRRPRPRGRARRGQIVCLPELFRTQYFCQGEDPAPLRPGRADPRPDHRGARRGRARDGDGRRRLALRAARGRRLPQHGRRPRRRRLARAASTARCTSPTTRSTTRSIYFTPGDLGFQALRRPRSRRVGTLVCWDQWYPEAARLTALHGAEVLFYPTAIGWHPAEKAEFGEAQHDAWETIQRAHAIANGVYVAAVNRVGHEGPAPAAGSSSGAARSSPTRSAASSPRPAATREEILIVDCDPRLQEETRRNWPFLRDRRIDAYEGITERFLD